MAIDLEKERLKRIAPQEEADVATSYGRRRYKVYLLTESEIGMLRRWAFLSLLVIPIPFFILAVLDITGRVKRETIFPDQET